MTRCTLDGSWRPHGKAPSKPRLDPLLAWRMISTRITDIEDVRQDVARARRIRHGVARVVVASLCDFEIFCLSSKHLFCALSAGTMLAVFNR
jgi:hypothetical protein